MKDLKEFERLISIRIIQEDAESIYSLLQSERDSIFSMEIIPYYALFVQACQEYMGETFFPEHIAREIKDIRNYIKILDDGFGKSQKRVSSVDGMQDKVFKEQLKFEFLKTMNVHLNLGTYWTDNRQVVGNTQQIADFLSINNTEDADSEDKNRCFQMGYHIGSFVASIREG